VQGGNEARPGRITVRTASTGKEELREKENAFELEAGDVVTVETGGGGGYGPPSERSLAAIQRDLDAGYVTRTAAESDYGVTVGPDGIARR
jgi:N-methylhydantoinase B